MKNVILFQRLEAAFLFVACIYFYHFFDLNFIWFIVLLLMVDVFMVGYLVSARVGAYVYNLGHSLLVSIGLLVGAALFSSRPMLALGIIWAAHIGLDRMLGYGLKNEVGFESTHLGRIGKKGL